MYFHALGTDQTEDRLVFSQPEQVPRAATRMPRSRRTASTCWSTSREGYLENAVHYRKIGEPDSAIRPLLDQWDALYGYVVNVGPVFLFETNKDAPRNRIIAVDLTDGSPEGNAHAPRSGPGSRRHALLRLRRRRQAGPQLPARRSHGRPPRRTERRQTRDPGRRGRAAGYRQRRRLRRPLGGHGDLLLRTPVSAPRRRSTATTWPTGESSLVRRPAIDADLGRLRDGAGLLREPRRHTHPDVHHPPQGDREERRQPDAALRLRRLQHLTDARLLFVPPRLARGWAACWRSRTCAAAASTAATGISPAPRRTSRTSSTTSSPQRSG